MYSPVRDLVTLFFKVSPDPPKLPVGSHGEVQIFRAAASYWRYRMLFYGIGMFSIFALVAAGSLAILRGLDGSLVARILVAFFLTLYVALGAIWYAIVRLDYEFRWYIVTDRSLRIRQGIVAFEETTLTFANVQNAEIIQGPLERAFGFANVLVETAGGGGAPVKGQPQAGWHRGLVRGLEDAERLRDLVRAAIARHGGAGLGDKEDHRAAPVVHTDLAPLAPALRDVLEETKALRQALEGRPA